MGDIGPLEPHWHVTGKVRSLAKTNINFPIQHVFAIGLRDIKLNPILYPGGCEALGSQPVLYVAQDTPLVEAIVQIASVALQQQWPLEIWLDRDIICSGSPANGLVRVTDVQLTRP
jgi:hypothetical protein